jgi:predicted XRE-type DNA-binding protein
VSSKNEEIEVVRGSGNVFRDVGHPNPDIEQLKTILAAQIIAVVDERELTTRGAEAITGIAAADFSRIRKAKLDRFTIDRLMAVLGRFDQKVDVQVSVGPRERNALQPA